MIFKKVTKCFTPQFYTELILWHLKDIDIYSLVKSEVPSILEPAVGQGDLITSVIDKLYSKYDLVAIDLEPNFNGAITQDFMTFESDKKFDICIMNPPYMNTPLCYKEVARNFGMTCKSNLFDLFVLKAMTHLKKDGILVALLSSNFARRDKNPITRCGKILRVIESKKKFEKVGISDYSIVVIKKAEFNKEMEPSGFYEYERRRVIDCCVIKDEDYDMMLKMRRDWLRLKDVCDCNDRNIKPFIIEEV